MSSARRPRLIKAARLAPGSTGLHAATDRGPNGAPALSAQGLRGDEAGASPPASELEAMARANKRLAEAQARAEAMIDEALAGAARIAEEARREGYQAGLAAAEAALARALEELDQARRGFEAAALAEARRQVAEALAAAMPELALLVASAARRVVDRELKTDPDTIDGLLRRALEPVREAGQARVRLAPPDLEWLLANPQRLQALASGMEIDWSADRSLAPGDVVVESPQGDVDGRLERQFERLARAMLRRVGSTPGAAPEAAEGGGGGSA